MRRLILAYFFATFLTPHFSVQASDAQPTEQVGMRQRFGNWAREKGGQLRQKASEFSRETLKESAAAASHRALDFVTGTGNVIVSMPAAFKGGYDIYKDGVDAWSILKRHILVLTQETASRRNLEILVEEDTTNDDAQPSKQEVDVSALSDSEIMALYEQMIDHPMILEFYRAFMTRLIEQIAASDRLPWKKNFPLEVLLAEVVFLPALKGKIADLIKTYALNESMAGVANFFEIGALGNITLTVTHHFLASQGSLDKPILRHIDAILKKNPEALGPAVFTPTVIKSVVSFEQDMQAILLKMTADDYIKPFADLIFGGVMGIDRGHRCRSSLETCLPYGKAALSHTILGPSVMSFMQWHWGLTQLSDDKTCWNYLGKKAQQTFTLAQKPVSIVKTCSFAANEALYRAGRAAVIGCIHSADQVADTACAMMGDSWADGKAALFAPTKEKLMEKYLYKIDPVTNERVELTANRISEKFALVNEKVSKRDSYVLSGLFAVMTRLGEKLADQAYKIWLLKVV